MCLSLLVFVLNAAFISCEKQLKNEINLRIEHRRTVPIMRLSILVLSIFHGDIIPVQFPYKVKRQYTEVG